MSSLKSYSALIVLIIICLSLCRPVIGAGESISLGNSSITWEFWPSGYSDGWYWGYDVRHDYARHEMLSGEWAAAIYYEGIASSPAAMWLNRNFAYPDFGTNSNFNTFGWPHMWNDPCNPVDGNDTAYTIIHDDPNTLEVRVDWEVADLGAGVYSPLGIIDGSGAPGFVPSARYVLLQTYTIKNVGTSNITGLKFYQMLHGHPAEIEGNNSGYYSTANYSDALANYTPHNTVHQVGNFRYDLTQQNGAPGSGGDHIDYMAFSVAAAPDSYEIGFFPHQSPPTSGTYVNMMNMSLNGVTFLADQEIAGAMGWNFGTLTSGQTKKLTMAIMFGSANLTYPATLTKTNADPCNVPVYPFNSIDNYLTYNLAYAANGYPIQSAVVTDYLPQEVYFDTCTGGGSYDPCDHKVTWSLGNLGASATGTLQLVTRVNYRAKPGTSFRNSAVFQCTDGMIADAICDVNVACWAGGDRVYVDSAATGFDNGTSWQDAYTSLDDALDAARHCDVTEIWLKRGIYRPRPVVTNIAASTFLIPSNVAIYGNFIGTEATPADRLPPDPNAPSLLTGDFTAGWSTYAWNVVTITNVDNVTVDGVTVADGAYSGIYVYNEIERNISITNCMFRDNDSGVKCRLADPAISACTFQSNGSGIFADEDSWPSITGCSFSNNSTAINLDGASSEITGCDIGPGNGIGIDGSYCWTQIADITIHGNTIGLSCDSYTDMTANNCIVSDSSSYGVSVADATVELMECTLEGNHIAVYGQNGANVIVERCLVTDSEVQGLTMETWASPVILNSIIRSSGSHGISCNGTNAVEIVNNWIVANGTSGGYGIDIEGIHSNPTIRNNTIANNGSGGIYRSGSMYPPNILNCIFWQNGSGGTVDTVGTFGNITYCRRSAAGGTGNITADPCFVNAGSGDYHLKWQSACIDAGSTIDECYYEFDIEMEDRVFDGNYDGTARVDIGADECYHSPADLDFDDLVNFIDYAIFMQSWLKSTGQPNWNVNCDFNKDGVVNGKDLWLIARDWLWHPQAHMPGADLSHFNQQSQMMMSMPDDSSASTMSFAASPTSLAMDAKSVAVEDTTAVAASLQDIIDWLNVVAQEEPQIQTDIAEFIQKVEQDLSGLSQSVSTDQ